MTQFEALFVDNTIGLLTAFSVCCLKFCLLESDINILYRCLKGAVESKA